MQERVERRPGTVPDRRSTPCSQPTGGWVEQELDGLDAGVEIPRNGPEALADVEVALRIHEQLTVRFNRQDWWASADLVLDDITLRASQFPPRPSG